MSAPQVLRLVGELTIYQAADLKAVILADPPPTEIDLSGVTEMDTAGLQLLILAKREATAAQRELHLVRHSPAVLQVFDLLNMAAYFGDHLVMDSTTGTSRS
jgi:anti-sigma B factor antagonist